MAPSNKSKWKSVNLYNTLEDQGDTNQVKPVSNVNKTAWNSRTTRSVSRLGQSTPNNRAASSSRTQLDHQTQTASSSTSPKTWAYAALPATRRQGTTFTTPNVIVEEPLGGLNAPIGLPKDGGGFVEQTYVQSETWGGVALTPEKVPNDIRLVPELLQPSFMKGDAGIPVAVPPSSSNAASTVVKPSPPSTQGGSSNLKRSLEDLAGRPTKIIPIVSFNYDPGDLEAAVRVVDPDDEYPLLSKSTPMEVNNLRQAQSYLQFCDKEVRALQNRVVALELNAFTDGIDLTGVRLDGTKTTAAGADIIRQFDIPLPLTAAVDMDTEPMDLQRICLKAHDMITALMDRIERLKIMEEHMIMIKEIEAQTDEGDLITL